MADGGGNQASPTRIPSVPGLCLRVLLERGQTVSLSSNALQLTGRGAAFVSESPAVASVDDTGVVTALAEGSARITANCRGDSCSVCVEVKPSLDDVMKRLTAVAQLDPFARETENLYSQWHWSQITALPDGVDAKALEFNETVKNCSGFGMSVKISPPGEGRTDICATALGKDWRVFARTARGWEMVGTVRAAPEPDVWSAKALINFPARDIVMITARPPAGIKGAFRAAYRLHEVLRAL